jgi:hypothetical protein
MKEKLLQLWYFIKAALLWTFIVFRRCFKVIIEETIKALQFLDTFIG